jgi:hypothetical protein
MNNLQTPAFVADILDDHTVRFEAREGVDTDAERVRLSARKIGEAYSGDYGMIVDRKADYSLDPVPVYAILDALSNLKAIAIVCYRSTTLGMIAMERKLSRGELEGFSGLDCARAWLTRRLSPPV